MTEPAPRLPRPLVSRIIDFITGALGHEIAFSLSITLVVAWILLLPHFGIENSNYQFLITTGTAILTFIMVFVVQHTSNRHALALHVKLDELLRASVARSEVIGVEDETTEQLKERKEELAGHREEDLLEDSPKPLY